MGGGEDVQPRKVMSSTLNPNKTLQLVEILRYLRIKDDVEEWGAIDFNSLQPLEFIENNYGRLCREIDQCISWLLLARGDPSIIGYLISIKNRLKSIRRRALAVIHDDQDRDVPQIGQINFLQCDTI